MGVDLRPELKNKLEGTEGYDVAKNTNNVAKLLTMIRGYCCQFDLLSDEYMAIVAAIKNLLNFFQKAEQPNADYHKDFMAMLQVIEEYGGAGSMTREVTINMLLGGACSKARG